MANSKSSSEIASSIDEKGPDVVDRHTHGASETPLATTTSDEKKGTIGESQQSNKVPSVEAAQAELTKTLSSGEGIVYPTGVKLGLVSKCIINM